MMLDPIMSDRGTTAPDPTTGLQGMHVQLSLPCPSCTYDLRGVSAAGNCPECGQSVPDVVTGVIDPLATALPRLADPRAVGDGLVLVSVGLAACAILPLVAMVFAGAAALAGKAAISAMVFQSMVWLAFVITLGGCVLGCWYLRPREGGPLQTSCRRAVGEVAAGAVAIAAGLGMFQAGGTLAMAGVALTTIGLAAGLMGLRKVLLEAGRRCRVFRAATLRRQRIPTLIFATVLAGLLLVGSALAELMGSPNTDLTLGVLGLTVLSVQAIGMAYLVVNTAWIRHDLRQPPPTLDELVG